MRTWIGRNLLNAAELAEWAERQGFSDLVPSAWHVTSGKATPGTVSLSPRQINLRRDPQRKVSVFGGLIVLELRSTLLVQECRRLIPPEEIYRPVRPHISVTPYRGQCLDHIVPFAGSLRLGPQEYGTYEGNLV